MSPQQPQDQGPIMEDIFGERVDFPGGHADVLLPRSNPPSAAPSPEDMMEQSYLEGQLEAQEAEDRMEESYKRARNPYPNPHYEA